MVKIEKDIEMPGKRGGSLKYPFRDMEVGDSFLVVDNERMVGRKKSKNHPIYPAASYQGKRLGRKFCVRKIAGDEMQADTYRCWRIE